MNLAEKVLAGWFFSVIGYINHCSFFTQKLWKEVEGFKDYDEAEIKCAFVHKWFHDRFGYFTCPVGCSYFTETKEDIYNIYIERFEPVFNAFTKDEQRRNSR